MAYSTKWEEDYDLRTAEVVAAALAVSLEPKPRVWPISGPNAREFNPLGHELSRRVEPKDPLGTKSTLETL